MASIKKFEDMEVWQKSRKLVRLNYQLTRKPEFGRDWLLITHLRKTAISIISNIAEGFERDGNKEFINFLYIAKGSCGELRSQLYVAFDQEYMNEEEFNEITNLAVEISGSIKGLIKYLEESDFKGIKKKN
jgi:four helix bundle protein